MSNFMQGEAFKRVEIAASGELGEFMRRFNQFVSDAQGRIRSLEEEHTRLVTSSKLLSYRKNRVETVLETLPEAVMILDESGTITFVNQKLAALFGVSPQVIMDQPVTQWCDHPDVLALLAKFQSDGKKRNRRSGFWHGRIDELAFFGSALTSEQIENLFQLTPYV